MSYAVSILPVNLSFSASEDDTLLAAGLEAKINLPHGCKNGSCGTCKCKMLSGKVIQEEYNPTTLTPAEAADNYILLCRAKPESDIVVDIPGFTNSLPIKALPVKIEAIDKIGTVAILRLKLPARQTFEFFAGQYIDIMYEGKNRSYSMANSPTQEGFLELHIRYRQGGVFSEAVWNQLQVGQILRLKGPLGNFTLKHSARPILMVATGTGFAPLKAILEYMIATHNQRQIHLVWGNFVAEDFYYTELFSNWQQQLNLTIQLCTNNPSGDNFYSGLVTDYVKHNFPDLSQHEIYACGNPAMIESLYTLATSELQLDAGNFLSDVFSPSK